jgi:hypothetical protein
MAVVIMLTMLVSSMAAIVVRPPTVVRRSVIWITPIVAVAAWVIPVSWISVIAIAGITEADSHSSDPN